MSDLLPSESGAPAADLKRTRRQKSASGGPAKLDRLPPHSVEAEQCVLGSVLLEPQQRLAECLARLRQGNDYFYDLRHQTIFAELTEMNEKREAIDLVTLCQRLKDKSLLEQVGGVSYLSSLEDAVPSAANLSYYLDIVWDKYILRKMIRHCSEVISRVYEYEGDVEQLVDEVETQMLKLSEEKEAGKTKEDSIVELVHAAITKIEEYHANKGMLTGLSTGFTDLDKMTTGMHGGEMIVIAARPSMGKTSLAMNIAEHVAVEQKQPVGVFSLEMTSESLVLRMLCSLSKVNLRKMREGFLAERDFPKITAAAGKLASAGLYIDDTPGLSILQLRAKARRMHQMHDIKLFVIDYLQLLHSTARRAEANRQQEIADISSGVKSLAKELNVPVIVLSQLNRELEREKSRKPRMSDLRESGSIEQDADLIGLLYKPSSGNEEEESGVAEVQEAATQVNLLIAKQRNGPTGDVQLTFLRQFTRFESASKIGAEDVPAPVQS